MVGRLVGWQQIRLLLENAQTEVQQKQQICKLLEHIWDLSTTLYSNGYQLSLIMKFVEEFNFQISILNIM